MVGSYSDVHCERTRRRVMEDLPAPPSPQMVMLIGIGGWLCVDEVELLCAWCGIFGGFLVARVGRKMTGVWRCEEGKAQGASLCRRCCFS